MLEDSLMAKLRTFNARSAKLTGEQILEIRDLYEAGWSQGRLAREFKMSVVQIGRIVRGESWAKLGGARAEQVLVEDPPSTEEVEASAERLKKLLGDMESTGDIKGDSES